MLTLLRNYQGAPLLRLPEKVMVSTTLAKSLENVAAVLRAQSTRSYCCKAGLNVVVESGDEAQEVKEQYSRVR